MSYTCTFMCISTLLFSQHSTNEAHCTGYQPSFVPIFFVFNKSILFISHNRRFVVVWINVLQTFWLSELRKRAHLLNKFCSSFKCVMFFHFKLFDVFCVLCYLFIFVIFANEQKFVQKNTNTYTTKNSP